MAKIGKTLVAVAVGAALTGFPGPSQASWEDREDTTIYKVVMNHEEQYSIWPAHRENPLGWNDVGKSGLKQECLDYIKEVWTDMRPLSLRKKMEEMERQRQQEQAGALQARPVVPVESKNALVASGALTGSKFSVTHAGPVAVLHLSGNITIGVGAVALRHAVYEVLNAGDKAVVLEMGHVSSIDSSGVGELVSAYTAARNRGAQVVLANLPQRLSDLLKVTQLITIFDVFDSEKAAIAAFK